MDATLTAADPSHGGHLLPNLVLFARSLRGLGLSATPEQVATLVRAAEAVGVGERSRLRDAGRAVLAHRREHLALFDRAFDLFWSAARARPQAGLDLGRRLERARRARPALLAVEEEAEGASPALESGETWLEKRRTYSDRERLRRKDFAELSAEERRLVARLLRERPLELPPRRSRRLRPARRGSRPDPRRSLRASLRYGGEPLELMRRERKLRLRPLVVLADVSGSMEPYARIFLQFIYSLRTATDRLEAFLFGTRLTRITRHLASRDVDRALGGAVAAVADWGGGTRIGESLRRFNLDWARRLLGRGAVVLVLSDGWDRGDVDQLEREVARLGRCCDRLMWLNPLLGSPGYRPLTRGIRAVLPHVDDFLPVHDLESLEQLADQLAELV